MLVGYWCGPSVHSVVAQDHPAPSELIQQLQSKRTTDTARKQLLRVGKSDPAMRKSLAASLPPLIEMGPDSCHPNISNHPARWHSCPWYNAVELAGELKIGEAAPALARWFNWREYGAVVGLGPELRLEPYVAARALAGIGDAAIPIIQNLLNSSDPDEHFRAVRVLCMINTPKAKAVLSDDLQHESNPDLQQMIKRALGEQ
jgi:PBS lyase HEAT-like repeat